MDTTDNLPHFEIDEAYLTSVTIYEHGNFFPVKPANEMTDDDLIQILKGGNKWSASSTEDSPEFSELRRQLGDLGYIRIENGYWNGDRVLKPFKLNDHVFKIHDQFSCGSAMGIQFKVERRMRQRGYKS